MRFKITLEIIPDAYGIVLPISYQHELSVAVNNLLSVDKTEYESWLNANGFTVEDCKQVNLYSISNLYVPKIYVQGDRLQINVPRVQFWISFYPKNGTKEFLEKSFLGKDIVIGDQISRVQFKVSAISDVSPIEYSHSMNYQSLSPIVVLGIRPDRSVEYLFPQNRYFGMFIVQELINKWEFFNQCRYNGDRHYYFKMLKPEKRKAVSVNSGGLNYEKVIGYMLKFNLVIDPQLQEIAYVCGVGDRINQGFGYLELINKSSE